MNDGHYKTLGVGKDATQDEIKKAFWTLSQDVHPDRPDGDKILFQRLQLAYETLKDDSRRQTYDTTGKDGVQQARDHKIASNLATLVETAFGEPDPFGFMRSAIRNKIQQQTIKLKQLAEAREHVLDSIKDAEETDEPINDKARSVIVATLREHLKTAERTIEEAEEQKSICEEMLEWLGEENRITDIHWERQIRGQLWTTS